jgi:1-acyl-sn-glycerol-3-phosphate acyltransferase
MSFLRFAVFNVLAWVIVVLWTVVLFLVWPFGTRHSYAVSRNWAIVTGWLVQNICGLECRVEGLENFPDDSCVVFLKHSSAYETFMQLKLFPRCCVVLKRELLWVPFFGWTLIPLKAIAIDRSAGPTAVSQVIEQGKERLAEGINVSIFPEGTRMAPGNTKRYGKSGTLLAQAAGCLIVPIAHNAGYHWPRRGFGIKPGCVTFVVGKPVDPRGRDAREVNEQIQQWMEAEVARIVTKDSAR